MRHTNSATQCLAWLVALLASAVAAGQEETSRRPADAPVPELARYLEQVEIYAPSVYRHLAIFPVRLRGGDELRGSWLTMDQALARGVLLIAEKGDRGLVPVVVVENRSRDDQVLILAGQLLAGGKQTRNRAAGRRAGARAKRGPPGLVRRSASLGRRVAVRVSAGLGPALAPARTAAGCRATPHLGRSGTQQRRLGSGERHGEPGTRPAERPGARASERGAGASATTSRRHGGADRRGSRAGGRCGFLRSARAGGGTCCRNCWTLTPWT